MRTPIPSFNPRLVQVSLKRCYMYFMGSTTKSYLSSFEVLFKNDQGIKCVLNKDKCITKVLNTSSLQVFKIRLGFRG